jgi:RHS repeat-associated protein
LTNKAGYQGSYSDFEEELGLNDFDLRTYDPQIGRWLQPDPYDEFSSPYVGMGNDPANNVDPSGGFIWDAIFRIAGTCASYLCPGTKVFNGASWGTAILSAVVHSANIIVSTQVGNDKKEFIKNGLENLKHFYKSADAAAVAWAKQNSEKSIQEGAEYSSIIYSISVKDEKKVKTYYTFTKPKRKYTNDSGNKAPGPRELKKEVPINGIPVAHIHSHGKYLRESDNQFSKSSGPQKLDADMMAEDDDLDYYLLAPNGTLKVNRTGDNFGTRLLAEGFVRDKAKYITSPTIKDFPKINFINAKGDLRSNADLNPINSK